MSKLVSVIIPCFNAQKWLAEAIDSCLQQSYPKIEVVVIDDGSTDNSLEIIKSYGDKLIWESGPNKGGNYARNRGFALSSGVYIQYLDADDYILPEKIERQVRFLEETGADVVYGDWRYRYHSPDGASFLGDIKVCGPKEDFLESLLANEQWMTPSDLLFKRAAVESCGGWDESLKAGQDRDFFISVVMNGAEFVYQSGCYSIYRRYGEETVSSSCKRRVENHYFLLKKAETKLSQVDRLSVKYCQALAKGYFGLARASLRNISYLQYRQFLEKTLTVCPEFKVNSSKEIYNIAQRIFGFQRTERFACFVILIEQFIAKRLINFVKQGPV